MIRCDVGFCRSCSAAITLSRSGRSLRSRATVRQCKGPSLSSGWTPTPTSTHRTPLPPGNIHGMPVAVIAGHGPGRLIGAGRSGADGRSLADYPARRAIHRCCRETPSSYEAAWPSTICAASTRTACVGRWKRSWIDSPPGRARPRELGRGLPRSIHRARRRHHGVGRPDLPRGAVMHGNDLSTPGSSGLSTSWS